MHRKSAGILPFRRLTGTIEVLLVHPGGPFWQKRDDAAWSIAKGEYGDDEQVEAAARREFKEETGWDVTHTLMPLGEVRQPSGKHVTGFAMEADFDPQSLHSNLFEIEWPPRSRTTQAFPEVDRAAWFSLGDARKKLLVGQRPFLDRLVELL